MRVGSRPPKAGRHGRSKQRPYDGTARSGKAADFAESAESALHSKATADPSHRSPTAGDRVRDDERKRRWDAIGSGARMAYDRGLRADLATR